MLSQRNGKHEVGDYRVHMPQLVEAKVARPQHRNVATKKNCSKYVEKATNDKKGPRAHSDILADGSCKGNHESAMGDVVGDCKGHRSAVPKQRL